MARTDGYVSPFSVAGWRKNPPVYPVVGCIILGCAMAGVYLARIALFSTDVSWNTKKNPEPWQAYEHKHYKFYQAEPLDVKNYQHPRPRF